MRARARRNGRHTISSTVCYIPWSNFVVGPDGRASFCCEVPEILTVGGRAGSIYRDSLDELWNADGLVEIRAAMARGEKPAACDVCWKREAAGGLSRRLLINGAYRPLGGELELEKLPDVGRASDYRLERRPDWLVLELGNVCNLKCRSCSPLFSSRIAADPVHLAWSNGTTAGISPTRFGLVEDRKLAAAEKKSVPWYHDIERMAEIVAGGGEENRVLSLLGGETFLIEPAWRLLEELVARGAAGRINVSLATNGQQRNERLRELAPHFRRISTSVSVDAYGKLYEYLRHGASWPKLVETLEWLREIPNLDIVVLPTLQNTNALDITALLRFLDERGFGVGYNVLEWPLRLRPTNLPDGVRRIAVQRLRHYLEAECEPVNVTVVRGLCEAIEDETYPFDPELFAEYMTFTNDLDASRGESLREVAPELWTLLRASGVTWSSERRHAPAATDGALTRDEILSRVNRTVSPNDLVFAGFEAHGTGMYFDSAALQVSEIDAQLRANGHPGLKESAAVADVGSHYGRMTRALRAALPSAAVYACDIDAYALRFCADELGALPVAIGWEPESDALPTGLDAIVSFSLLTHTTLRHWRESLRAWARMLRPGGVAAFTYLSDRRLASWRAGEMEHYGTFSDGARDDVERSVRESGHGFAPLTSHYGGKAFYGIAFVTPETVRREVEAAGLELIALPDEMPNFGQELAIARKPREEVAPPPVPPVATRDVSVVALYDPRAYASASDGDGAESMWSQLLAADTRPLPTELGFGDPRVPDVREAQAALAAQHGVDGFCYRYRWGGGPRWDAPLRSVLATGRPAMPFCLIVEVEDPERYDRAEARRLFDDMLPALKDERYLRVDGAPLIVVKDIAQIAQPRTGLAAWREAALEAGLGALHLCIAERDRGDRPDEFGADSSLMLPPADPDFAQRAAASMARPWSSHRAFRMVESVAAAEGPEATLAYELWLQSAIEATRRRGERLVFVDAWNDWTSGRYLEPDDRGGRAMLQATRRAARGPASGLALVRRLRDALSADDGAVGDLLAELNGVLEEHERGRERISALVEAALVHSAPLGERVLSRLPVPAQHLPSSPGRVMIDHLDGVGGVPLHTGGESVFVRGEEAVIVGWAHCGDAAPELVDVFVAFESEKRDHDMLFPIAERFPRPDVGEHCPGFPERIGFRAALPVRELMPGTYRLTVLQRAPHATYRDVTPVVVVRENGQCSSR
ncbi:MAG TPA: twitch domain-containing radical SAM protein [Candidatus Limnocylindrales bacterium]|nr:twitch domain-containing radical SAM protein [Candidatus Limnocylindrales bacterium]